MHVGGSLENRDVEGMLTVECIDRSQQFLFCQRIIFVRHTEVPQYIFVARLGYEFVPRQLHVVVIRPYRDNLEFACLAVKIYLEIICSVLFVTLAGKFAAFLKRYPG